MAREQFQTLTEPMYYVLLALTKECCGVDVMGKVREISRGRITVGPGTLYALLPKLEESGLITQTRQEKRQKWYRITGKGREMLEEETGRLRRMIEDAAPVLSEEERDG